MNKYNLEEVIRMAITELSGVSRASANTLEAYGRDLRDFLDFCTEHNIDDIRLVKKNIILLHLKYLHEKELAKNSISRKLSAIRRLFNFSVRNNLIEQSPVKKIPNPKFKRKLPETISLDSFLEIYRLIDEENENDCSKRNKAIFELLYGCALRVSELCGLNIGDIDLSGMNIRVFGKGSKTRIVPLGKKSKSIIEDYINSLENSHHGNPLLLYSNNERITRHQVYSIVKKYLSRVSDIEKKSPHILRHSAATHMLDRDADLMAVKEILGHENLSTTQIYTHVSIERLKKSYKKAHPKSQEESL
ncbi:MAG: tyrosine-type recombinase/integrase [Ignavibacteriales bacterium]|nr:tyrosine-type recombinase/integrase [Ignavibacteriales bacterium]